MELVRSAALTGYFSVADELRLDVTPLLRNAGLSRAMLESPEQMIPARAVVRLLEDSAKASDCLTFGLRMAARRELADLGLVSLLLAHQPTLGEALAVMGEYRNRINTNLMLRVEQFDGLALLREVFTFDPPLACRQAEDLAIAVLDRMCRTVLGAGWQPISISFRYDAPPASDRIIYQQLFDCPVEFGSEFDGILVSSSTLEMPNPRSEPALALHARKLIGTMVDPGERTVVEEVEQAIMVLLPAGRAAIETVADTLGITVRTLQRRLVDEGTTFSEVLNRLRVREVTRHFEHRRHRLTDIAHMLGYASLGAFSRWYSENFDETPSEGRKRTKRR
ncbi:AraC family transcriptional regulator [Sphingomonas sp. RB56-2]|uniref:AraC family transcriptional regulator n=1 Tax=Sphingomonas brevis TaxID=2908206 RepID=A0ABT0S9K8_9SPHN|nr:AraC family transcriptional regulator [Sphingomonas brevis]MCL6741062.1 AraC family transcriptional regulator [Sphingomonas brevis]